MPCLYVAATPIGNLEDITLRALRALEESGLIAAEDTRTTGRLLRHYGIETPLVSFNEHNQKSRTPEILARLATEDVALVTDAGMPGISDPGLYLVEAARGQGADVVPIPGPSAVTAAVAASGIPSRSFLFLGFLPRRRADRRRALEAVSGEEHALVMFEAPHRLKASLEDMLDCLGDREMAVCREMTKFHEEIFRGTVSQAMVHFSEPRGEMTVVIAPPAQVEDAVDDGQIKERLSVLKAEGLRAREAVAKVAASLGASKNQVYRVWLELSG